VRRIGTLYTFLADDPEGQARNAAFLQALQPLGWTVGGEGPNTRGGLSY